MLSKICGGILRREIGSSVHPRYQHKNSKNVPKFKEVEFKVPWGKIAGEKKTEINDEKLFL